MLRAFKAFFPALLFTYALASVLATASVMSSLRQMGVDVEASVQLEATWHDLLGMSTSYLLLILVALLIAWPVAAWLIRLSGGWRGTLYALAGAVALLVLHQVLHAALQITPIAAARSMAGLAGQCLAGALGGLLFAALSRRRPGREGD